MWTPQEILTRYSSSPFNIAVFTPGGDAAGSAAFIYHIAQRVAELKLNWGVMGIRNSLYGMLEDTPEIVPLKWPNSGKEILLPESFASRSSTPLGSQRGKPTDDQLKKFKTVLQLYKVGALAATVGDGGSDLSLALQKLGIGINTVIKTVDGNGPGEHTLGLKSAIQEGVHIINKVRETATSNGRFAVVTFMGRNEGHLALQAGIQADADAIIIPEVPVDFEELWTQLKSRYMEKKAFYRNHYSNIDVPNPCVVLVIAEGAKTPDGHLIAIPNGSQHPVLGKIGEYYTNLIKERISKDPDLKGVEITSQERSYTVRSADTVPEDVAFGHDAANEIVDAIVRKEYGKMAIIRDSKVALIDITEAQKLPKHVMPDNPFLLQARKRGISLGNRDHSSQPRRALPFLRAALG
jgi:6-phosphofructokinase